MSVKGQGHSLTLVKGWSDFKVNTCFSQKQLGELAKVKFGHIGFLMGKSENYFFFLETIAALGLKVA